MPSGIDPSYEIKTDYGRVAVGIQDALKRFPTGTYMVWYPIIPRTEAHDLPTRLKTLSTQAKRPWLHATLAIGQDPTHGPNDRPGRDGVPNRARSQRRPPWSAPARGSHDARPRPPSSCRISSRSASKRSCLWKRTQSKRARSRA